MSQFDVVVVGSFCFDMTCAVDSLPSKGETKLSTSFSNGCGGKGTNQCIQAARLGAKTGLICKVGSDWFGEHLLDLCKLEGVDNAGIYKAIRSPTAIAHITIDSKGENSIVVATGANYDLSVADIEASQELIQRSKVLICQNEIREEVSIAAMKTARCHGILTVMNAAPAKVDFKPEIFTLSDVFIVNCFEASQISGLKISSVVEAEAAAKAIFEKGCKSVVVTMGKEGLVYLSEKEKLYVPSTNVAVVDSTGAGDSFVGAVGFFLSTASGKDMETILTKASYIAALSVQKMGAQGGMPRVVDLPALFV